MKPSEMLYVLDKEKECVQIRGNGQCEKDCSHCSCHMDTISMLDALDRIETFITMANRNCTRKRY